MVERDSAQRVATFFAPETPVAGTTMVLGEDAAHHMRVRRLAPGEQVRLTDGAGTIGMGALVRVSKNQAAVDVAMAFHVEPLAEVHLLVPIADRERMLWLAEKSVELGATTWRPVLWRRSRSVTPRGEGVAFTAKVRARMIAALEQSGGAWLPVIYPEAPPDRAIAATPQGSRLVLDQGGQPLLAARPVAPIILAVGPEGGLEGAELEALRESGFTPVSVAASILRFETAGAAGLALARAAVVTMEHLNER